MTDPTSRALQLLGLLESRAVWSGSELADRLGVTTRTVRRDVDRLRSLGYTVEADTGTGGGYALGRGQVLPPLLLADDEATAATLALTAATAGGGVTDPEAALRALGKIDDVMPAALRAKVQGLRATMDLTATRSSVDGELLLRCAEATRRRLRLRFEYRDRRGEQSSRDLEPHRLTARGRSWYLTGFDVDRQDWRSFRLDRIAGIQVSTWQFRARAGWEEAVARLGEPPPVTAWRHQVVVHVHAPYDVVRPGMSAGSGELSPLDASTTLFRAGADDPETAAWWLARLAHDFTVVSDDAVRDAVARLGGRLRRAVDA